MLTAMTTKSTTISVCHTLLFRKDNIHPKLHLPDANPFIPTDLSIRKLPSNDCSHPLLMSSVKICDSKSKSKNFFPAVVTKFDSTNSSLLLSYEDEDQQFHKLDDDVSFFKEMREGDGFTLGGGRLKCKLIALGSSGGGIKFGDGTDYDVDDGLQFPPIPPPTLESHLPKRLFDTETLRLFHAQDRLFKRPSADVRIKLTIPGRFMTSPRHHACMDLLYYLVDDTVTETVYMASVCELFYSIGANESGFSMRFHGFSDKLEALANYVLDFFLKFRKSKTLPPEVGKGRFNIVLESLRREYSNSGMSVSSHADTVRVACLIRERLSSFELLRGLEDITEDKFMKTIGEVLGKLSLEVLCMGNVTEVESQKIGEMINRSLKVSVAAGGGGERT